MNKNKIYYLLLGIGLGILVTSSMNIAFNKTEKVEYSEAEIKEKAKELGMISIKDNIEKNEEDEAKEAKEEAAKKEAEKEKLEEEKKAEEVASQKEEQNESAIITVTPQDGASDVIERLKASDIIENQDEFKNLVSKYNLEKKFRTGEYEIQKKSSYAEVLRIMIKEDELKEAGFL